MRTTAKPTGRSSPRLVDGKRRQFQIEKSICRKDGSSIWVSNNVSLVPRHREGTALHNGAVRGHYAAQTGRKKLYQRSEGYLA